MKKILCAFVLTLLLGVPSAVYAEENQEHRIDEGVKSGEINQREERKLHRMEKRADRDGVRTPRENRRINRKIYRAKHNRR